MTAPDLFKGIAVVIDNGIGKEDSIDRIIQNIRDSGGHAIGLTALPKADYDLDHFSRVSFFIMDWNLGNSDTGEPLEAGIRLPETLNKAMIADNIEFLKRLSRSRHAPVFIFSNETPETVVDELKEDPDLLKSVEESHILVMSKGDVVDKLYAVLEGWAQNTPSVLTLKKWERGYLRAANELFIDLHNRTPYWPVLLWQTFGADEVPPEYEMNRLLNRLVESRMGLLDLDLAGFLGTVDEQKAKNTEAYLASMNRVLEGERFLRDDRLKENIFAPGDIFIRTVDANTKTYWMNVRAECDCLRGNDDLQLYLLQVKPINDVAERIDHTFGIVKDERDNEAIVFAMMDGVTFSIKFKDLKAKSIKQLKNENFARAGRLLPPFITRVQQRYAAYIQRPGMPRIPSAFEDVPRSEEASAAE